MRCSIPAGFTDTCLDKARTRAQLGLFLGCRMAPCYQWDGECLVEGLAYFAGLDSSCDAVGHSKPFRIMLRSRFGYLAMTFSLSP